MEAPQNPAGVYVAEANYGPARRDELIAVIEAAPAALRSVVSGLSEEQLETRYRNWSIRQIVNHLADSHVNAYIRFKLALTEEKPTVKPYDESRWSALEEARTGDVRASLSLLDGLHSRWTRLLRSMGDAEFRRSYFHPELDENVTLAAALSQYVWHCRHHTAQIQWVREQRRW